MSPRVATADIANVPASMRSQIVAWSAGVKPSTPSTSIVLEPAPSTERSETVFPRGLIEEPPAPLPAASPQMELGIEEPETPRSRNAV